MWLHKVDFLQALQIYPPIFSYGICSQVLSFPGIMLFSCQRDANSELNYLNLHFLLCSLLSYLNTQQPLWVFHICFPLLLAMKVLNWNSSYARFTCVSPKQENSKGSVLLNHLKNASLITTQDSPCDGTWWSNIGPIY